jgi:hypothetical protein
MTAPSIDVLMTIIHDLMSRDIILNDYGIFNKKAQKNWYESQVESKAHPGLIPFTRDDLTAELNNITRVIEIIPFLVIKTTRKGLVGSYGLKHVLERHTSHYISNGVSILAMLYLKYGMVLSTEGSFNCTFLCNYVKSDACIKI